MAHLSAVRLIIVIGQYAQKWHLPHRKKNLTETVRAWRDYGKVAIPIPHPSPRNNIWMKKNPWFADTLLPELKKSVRSALD